MRISLANKFIGIAAFIMLLALGISSYINIKIEKELLLDNLVSKGQSLGGFTALIIPEAVLSYDFVELDIAIAELTKNDDVLYAVIESSEGVPLTTFIPKKKSNKSPATSGTPMSAIQLKDFFDSEGQSILEYQFPINNGNIEIANLTLGLTKKFVNEASDRIIRNNLIQLFVILIVLALALYTAFRLLAVNPIKKLSTALEAVAHGQLSNEVTIVYNDEIGDLGKTFNNMAKELFELEIQNINVTKKLEIKAEELSQFNEQLESIVKHRTKELELKTEKLMLSNAELDKFAYVASHDLKAPLRAIASLSEWIEDDLDDVIENDTRNHLTMLRSRVHRLEKLIDGILEYSRAGRMDMKGENVNVTSLVTDIVQSLNLPDTFTIEIDQAMPEISTASIPLSQVFSNLIANAISHHDKSLGRIKIFYSSENEDKGYYTFAIADDGPGIEESYREKVFQIFQTLRARDDFESTGIGLSLVKKIVIELGGSISIYESEMKGAEFRFTLPK